MMNYQNNNYGYGYPGGYYGGNVYQQPQEVQMTQGLTPDQLKAIRKTSGFNLEITQDELWRSFCTHRTEHSFAVVTNDDGTVTCTLCGTRFRPYEHTVHEAKDLVDKVVDLMETTKMQCVSLPTKTIQDFFQIEPILKRLPELYSQSIADAKRVTNPNGGYTYGQEYNEFNVYQNLLNPMAGNGYYDPAAQPVYGAQPMYGMPQQQPMYGQPAYGMPQQQPMYGQPYGMPQQQPMYGQPNGGMPQNQAPQGNPFDSGNTQQPQHHHHDRQREKSTTTDTVTVTKTLTD